MKIKEDIFKKAADIAHGEFWLSDDPRVVKMARKTIKNRDINVPPENLMAHYTAIICHKAAIVEDEVQVHEQNY